MIGVRRVLPLAMLAVMLAASSGSGADIDFVVLSGTWWMGTGEKFDPDTTVAVPAGSYVIHYGGKVHYDGAKNEETIIQVWGMGPPTFTPVGPR
jgi:hypothetical protein